MSARLIAIINGKPKVLAKQAPEESINAMLKANADVVQTHDCMVQRWDDTVGKWRNAGRPKPNKVSPAKKTAPSASVESGADRISTEQNQHPTSRSAGDTSSKDTPASNPDTKESVQTPDGSDMVSAPSTRVQRALKNAARNITAEQDETNATGDLPADREAKREYARKLLQETPTSVFGVDVSKLGQRAKAAAGGMGAFGQRGWESARNMGADQIEALLVRVNGYMPILKQAGFEVETVRVKMGIPPNIELDLQVLPEIDEEMIVTEIEEHTDDHILIRVLQYLLLAYQVQKPITVKGKRFSRITVGLLPPSSEMEFT